MTIELNLRFYKNTELNQYRYRLFHWQSSNLKWRWLAVVLLLWLAVVFFLPSLFSDLSSYWLFLPGLDQSFSDRKKKLLLSSLRIITSSVMVLLPTRSLEESSPPTCLFVSVLRLLKRSLFIFVEQKVLKDLSLLSLRCFWYFALDLM